MEFEEVVQSIFRIDLRRAFEELDGLVQGRVGNTHDVAVFVHNEVRDLGEVFYGVTWEMLLEHYF